MKESCCYELPSRWCLSLIPFVMIFQSHRRKKDMSFDAPYVLSRLLRLYRSLSLSVCCSVGLLPVSYRFSLLFTAPAHPHAPFAIDHIFLDIVHYPVLHSLPSHLTLILSRDIGRASDSPPRKSESGGELGEIAK